MRASSVLRESKVDENIFSAKVKYADILKTLKKEFVARWEANQPSTICNFDDDFETVSVVGSGSFGTVKLCRNKETNKYYAVKIILKETVVRQKQVKHIHMEKHVLSAVRFPFCVHLDFSFKDNDCLYLGLPFINGGELFTYHRKLKKFTEKQAKFYAAQVMLAIEYLHYMELIYRDLKPENILIDHKGYVKLTDFGFCKPITGRTWTLCGTPEYLAPEVIQTKAYGKSVDWWAFGIFSYELVAGFSPFYSPNEDPLAMYAKIIECKYKFPIHFSNDLKSLVQNLLQVDISRRYGNLKNGTKDIKDHPWLKTVDFVKLLNYQLEAPYVPATTDIHDSSNFDKYPSVMIRRSKTNKYANMFEEF